MFIALALLKWETEVEKGCASDDKASKNRPERGTCLELKGRRKEKKKTAEQPKKKHLLLTP